MRQFKQPLVASMVATAVALASGGCAIVSSERIGVGSGTGQAGLVGMHYMLPKALLPLQVLDMGGALQLDILQPVMVGDPAHSYALRHVHSAFGSDTVHIEIDPATSLLKTVTLDSKDETGEVLKQAIASAKGLRAELGGTQAETVVYQTWVDPGDASGIQNAQQAMNAAVLAYVSARSAECAGASPETPVCAEYKSLNALAFNASGATGAVTITVRRFGDSAAAAAPPSTEPDCSTGICHRGAVPYELHVSLLGQGRSTLVQLPNGGPVLALPMARQPFVNVHHSAVLQNGVLQSYDATKPSSALAIVSWPVDVMDAVVSTTAKIVQFKIDTSKDSVRAAQQVLDEAKEKKRIGEELEALKKAKPEGAGLIGMGAASTALLSVTVGKTTALPGGQGPGFSGGAAAPRGAPLSGSDGALGAPLGTKEK